MSWQEFWCFVVILLVIVLIIYGVGQLIADLRVDATCLEHGWRDHRVTFHFRYYCIREENAYEITKPLSVILEESK